MVERRTSAKDLAQIAVFAALIAALGLPGTLFIGGSAVPITMQTLGVMLAGALLGARKGLLAVGVFNLLVLSGLPLLAGGRGGPSAVFVSPSAGYVWGFMLGALVIGVLTQRILPAYPLWLGIIVTALGGILAIYAIGIPWTAWRQHLPLWTAAANAGIYLPGDALKVVVTAVIARQVHRAYPGLVPTATTRRTANGLAISK